MATKLCCSALVCCLALMLSPLAQAQSVKPATSATKQAAGQSWAEIAKWPDFTAGVWSCCEPGASSSTRNMAPAPLKTPRSSNVVPAGETCLPIGIPAVMVRPYPFEFIFAPGRITLLLELDGLPRRIYTDGRTHPEDPDLTYGGHSIGHWEKDTLVVDTVGILPDVQITAGVPAQGPVHIVERMHLTKPDELTIDTTVEAPAALTGPWSYSMTYRRHRDWSINEYYCLDKDDAH